MDVEPLICSDQVLNQLAQDVYGVTLDIKQMLAAMESEDVEAVEEAGDADINLTSMQDMAQEAPVIRMVNSILRQALRDNASDIHIRPEKDRIQLRFRVDGELQEIPAPPRQYFMPLVSRLKLLAHMDISSDADAPGRSFHLPLGRAGGERARLEPSHHPRREHGAALAAAVLHTVGAGRPRSFGQAACCL